MVLKLYIFKGSPTVRAVMVTAKAIEIELELQELDYIMGKRLSPEFVKRTPKALPTLVDNGTILRDSHAINAYLVRKYGKDDCLYPIDLVQRAIIDERLHFDSRVMLSLVEELEVSFFIRKEVTRYVLPRFLVTKIHYAYQIMEDVLEDSRWIAGDNVTIADFNLIATTTSLDYHLKINPKKYPKVAEWMKRTQALPYFSSDHEQLQWFAELFKIPKANK